MIVYSNSAEETFELGKKLGQKISAPRVICFFGDLAAGKTTLIKGLVVGATGLSPDQVSSPTFVLLNIYEGTKAIYHFDLYRLQNSEGFFSLGFEEYWHAPGLCCIEWAERIQDVLPEHPIIIRIRSIAESKREISIEGADL